MKPVLIVLVLVFLSIPAMAQLANDTAEVSLAWDANTETNLAGYKLYYGLEPRTSTGWTGYDGVLLFNGDSPVPILLEDLDDPQNPLYTVYGLVYGHTYYFALTAFDTDGLESEYSEEVNYFPPIPIEDVDVNNFPPQPPTGLRIIKKTAS